jgi:3-oxoacyl-[acyl-carrier-protein] synthase-3
MPLTDVTLSADGSAGRLIQVNHPGGGPATLELQGKALSVRAIKAMGRAVRTLADKHGLVVEQLSAIAIHGGNGRFPALFARHLGVPPERVLSQTSMTGNLGSASLPVAWETATRYAGRPVIWTAVGAGLTWGAALFEG